MLFIGGGGVSAVSNELLLQWGMG